MRQLSAPDRLEEIIRKTVPLAQLLTWGTGGTARTLISPKDGGELALAMKWLRSEGFGFHVIGGGSNSLVADGEIEDPVISTRGMNSVSISREGGSIFVTCGAGVFLKNIFALSLREGWSGLEHIAGIPGTVGGAIIGNAGTKEGEMSSVVRTVSSVRGDGEPVTMEHDEIEWGYRRSSLAESGQAVVSSAVLRLRESTKEAVTAAAKHTLEQRSSQPLGARTAGCVFKNPPRDKAGRLLEAAGCKGLSVGGAKVSEIHANFIENHGDCSAMDIANLARLCRDMVYEKFGVTLRFEIKSIGFERGFMEG
jgi:UDP-N-acetylmuramate dehydrogenase